MASSPRPRAGWIVDRRAARLPCRLGPRQGERALSVTFGAADPIQSGRSRGRSDVRESLSTERIRNRLFSLTFFVGTTGIEPATPTVSRRQTRVSRTLRGVT